MGITKIEWTSAVKPDGTVVPGYTFNAWEGCQKVSPGCANCYAERRDKQYHGGEHWGPNGTRKMMSESYWKQPLKWNRDAQAAGERRRVFCSSLADVFEGRPGLVEPRSRLFKLIQKTPNLDWLLLTKRPENIISLTIWSAPGCKPSENIWFGATVENQKEKRRIDDLRKIPAAVRFLSCEPLLEDLGNLDLTGIHWLIVGGESGPNARPMHPKWARSLRDQCQAAGVPFFFKQWGKWGPQPVGDWGKKDIQWLDDVNMWRVGKKAAGRLLDGKEWNELPAG